MPMPRLTSMPLESSCAIRRAMISCGVMTAPSIPDDVVDNRRGCDDVVRRHHTNRNDVLGAGDNGICCHCHHGIKIACRQRIAEVAEIIGKKRMHEGELRMQCSFEQI